MCCKNGAPAVCGEISGRNAVLIFLVQLRRGNIPKHHPNKGVNDDA